MVEFNRIEDMEKFYAKSDNTFDFTEISFVKINFPFKTAANIRCNDLSCKDITANDITAIGISAGNLTANDIIADNINTDYITCNTLSYGKICFADRHIKCKKLNPLTPSAKCFVLKGYIEENE